MDLGNAGVTRWRRAFDRREWASAVRQANAKLQGPLCYTRLFSVAKPCNLVKCIDVADGLAASVTDLPDHGSSS